ncbi:PfkB family carbohydrate kinase [Treponema sp. OMZ 840]|uniref:PfkB family carbohydrate kinase n=1 Tax=Treponema sp. OMZ 840 TaxID=244313 RepID=UPI003D8FE40C
MSGIRKHDSFQYGFLTEAEKQGYQVQICFSSSAGNERKNIAALCKNNPDALLWEPVDEKNMQSIFLLTQNKIPFVMLNAEKSEFGIVYDYTKAGYAAAKELIKLGHRKIYCLCDKTEFWEQKIRQGVERCLFDHHSAFIESKDLQEALSVHHCSAIICCGWDKALWVYEYTQVHKFCIPRDISVLCIDDEMNIKPFPPLSVISLSLYNFGKYVCNCLIQRIEKNKLKKPSYSEEFICKNTKSMDFPSRFRSKRIIVIGSINMDILLSVKNHPQTGESVPANSVSMIPGGKGINQAVGAAKLGAKVSLIGGIGRDFDGNVILNVLHENTVDTSAVLIDCEKPTGKAYIHVQADGESGIVLYGGANLSVCADTVSQNEKLFTDAAFCLLQTEIPMPAVKKVIEIAQKNKVKIMLKPSAIAQIDETLLSGIDYFIPNRKELDLLCPIVGTIKEKAAWFLERGVKTIIVTLDSEGCYMCQRDHELYVPAAPFTAVDTTGAADAFISALAVCLLEDKELSDALLYAVCAAGFSITRTGVVPSLIDSATLRHYMHKFH